MRENAKDRYWKRFKPEELKTKMLEQPVTREGLRKLVLNSCIEASIIDFENPEGKGVTMYCGCDEGAPKYFVVLNGLRPHKEQAETFAHELVHIYYGCGAACLGVEKLVEDIVERESVKLITKYRALVESILLECVNRLPAYGD